MMVGMGSSDHADRQERLGHRDEHVATREDQVMASAGVRGGS